MVSEQSCVQGAWNPGWLSAPNAVRMLQSLSCCPHFWKLLPCVQLRDSTQQTFQEAQSVLLPSRPPSLCLRVEDNVQELNIAAAAHKSGLCAKGHTLGAVLWYCMQRAIFWGCALGLCTKGLALDPDTGSNLLSSSAEQGQAALEGDPQCAAGMCRVPFLRMLSIGPQALLSCASLSLSLERSLGSLHLSLCISP